MSLSRAEIAKRIGVFVVVVGLIVVAAAGAAALFAPTPTASDNVTPPNYSEMSAGSIAPDRVEATGTTKTLEGVDAGVVVIDRGHDNRFQRGDITALETALTQAGAALRYLDAGGQSSPVDAETFNESLADADAFVIIDPGVEYGEDKLTALEEFVDSGGRLLLAGEPTYNEVEIEGLQAELVTNRNRLATVGSQFGLAFGTEYLVNMRAGGSDALYKNVKATGGQSGFGAGVEEAVFYTATTVRPAAGGSAVLTGVEGTELARAGGSEVSLAALNPGGTVMGVGDTTFMSEPNHNVADNEVFIVRIVQFLAEGDASFEPPESDSAVISPDG